MSRKVAYWVSTIFVALIMTVSGGLAIAHAAPMMKALAHLGYPPYFANLLGVGKIVGLFVFLLPVSRSLRSGLTQGSPLWSSALLIRTSRREMALWRWSRS